MKLVIVLLFVALIVAAIVWWRALLRQRADHIDRYPYAKFLDKRLAARRPELSAAQRTPVSYTHLDVYKRQALEGACTKRSSPM